MRAYASEDNERWEGFEHRAGDIVISTRTKSGTTWTQMICALLVFGTDDLPEPLVEISPWVDWDIEPIRDVRARLDAQEHRRIIKTHTPLDGIPLHPDVTYLVVGRHPLDVAVSMFHHVANLDRERIAELRGTEVDRPSVTTMPEWLDRWWDLDVPPEERLDTLRGLVHHVRDAAARSDESDVILLHYRNLTVDTEGQMRSIAAHLGITIPESTWPDLVAAASFGSMRERSRWHAPDHRGVLHDTDAFFRGGRVGDGVTTLTPDEVAEYERRVRAMAEPDLVRWLHDGGAPPAIVSSG